MLAALFIVPTTLFEWFHLFLLIHYLIKMSIVMKYCSIDLFYHILFVENTARFKFPSGFQPKFIGTTEKSVEVLLR